MTTRRCPDKVVKRALGIVDAHSGNVKINGTVGFHGGY